MEKPAARGQARTRLDGIRVDHAARCRALAAFLDRAVPPGAWVVVYDALGDEVRLDDLLAVNPEPATRYAVTRTPDDGHALTVHPVGGPTEQHRYGFRQPRADSPQVPDDAIGAVLVPGLGFDWRGTRLGRGGGYYDRFLARLDPGVLRVGMVVGLVLADPLPVEDHDVAMTHLATADGITPIEGDR